MRISPRQAAALVLLTLLLGAALLYAPAKQDSPVIRREMAAATVLSILQTGESRFGRQPLKGYRIALTGDGQTATLRTSALLAIGQPIRVERAIHANGHISHHLATP